MTHDSIRNFGPSLNVGFLLKRCASLLAIVGETPFESHQLTTAGFTVLMHLQIKSPLTPSELSTLIGHDLGGLTRIVDALEQASLVNRERMLNNRRSIQITITSQGIKKAEQSLKEIVSLLNQVLEPFSKPEVEALVSSLQRLFERLQEYREMQPRAEKTLPSAPSNRVSKMAVKSAKRKDGPV